MNKILFVCNTYFQLIVSIQLKLTVFKEACVDIAISDHSINSENVAIELKKQKLFNDVFYIETVKLDRKCRDNKLIFKQYTLCMFGKGDLKELKIDVFKDKHYDRLFFYNLTSSIISIFCMLYSVNKNIKCSMMEEGILSYRNQLEEDGKKYSKRIKYIAAVRALLKKKNLFELTEDFYCFYPTLYKGHLLPKQIPNISRDSKIKDILRDIFAIDKEAITFSEKYVYFSSICDFEGGKPIGEFELIQKIADTVGKDNLLVKKHPRDTRDVYKRNNIKVMKNSYIPWEAIQLSCDFSDKIFISATSTSIISANLMVDKPVKSYYFFSECDIESNSSAVNSIQSIQEILSSEALSGKLHFLEFNKTVSDLVE